MVQIVNLKTEHRNNPMGIDAARPRFSWQIVSDEHQVQQTAYRLLVSEEGKTIYDSGKVSEGQSQNVRYAGQELKSAQRLSWNVTVWTQSENGESECRSEDAFFEMGLLKSEDWQANWVEPEGELDPEHREPSPYLRKVFSVKHGLKSARIYQSAQGLYEFWMNGQRGCEEVFKPGFTSYYHRVQYQVHDVTTLLTEGVNVWAVVLGDGWWRGTTGGMYRHNFGYKLAYIGQLVLEYDDHTEEIIGTDDSWKTSTGGLRASDMRAGDIYDARLEPENWKMASYDDTEWATVHLATDPHATKSVLIPSRSVEIKEFERFHPTVFQDQNGDTILDFGQNIAGYVHMVLRGCSRGQKIELEHGEDIKEGCFNLDNIDGMFLITDGQKMDFQKVIYYASGADTESYCPMFSIFGFRYVRIRGYQNIDPEDFTAIAVYSACEETGSFHCSNDLINRLVENCRWSQKGNFLDVPTDCPTRERSPWTGDSQVYAKTASLFMNVYPFFEKWMYDLTLEQMPSGKIANTFPSTNTLQNEQELERLKEKKEYTNVFGPLAFGNMKTGNITDGSAGWGDTATITPFTMYLCYGDTQILENQYDSAKKWVEYMLSCAKNPSADAQRVADASEYHTYTDGELDAEYVWDTCFQWGEWLEPDVDYSLDFSPEAMAKIDPEVPTAYMAHSAELVSQMAEILGKKEDAARYGEIAQKIKRIFQKHIIRADGVIKEGRQAPHARALQFALVDEGRRDRMAEVLNQCVISNDYHLNTGFLSTPFLLNQLAEHGYLETAYRLLEQTDSPGWLYPVTLGSTTILENWTGMERHESSYNHYSYGAVCDFMFSYIAGIQPDIQAPGYKHFFLAPQPGGTLTDAEADYESIYGVIHSAWRKHEDGTYTFSFSIPANTTATVKLPGKEQIELGSGRYEYTL
ncbi:MAG: glycoside hydrolase family 78 protein [Lachnospiraceae bacterium]|nr:glycoside hydrolase family 78 protein [Lachnospiraceae bacterium]